MNRKLLFGLLSIMIISLAFTFTENSDKDSEAAARKKKVKLEYNYPQDKAVKYLSKTNMKQIMDIQGMVMENNILSTTGCSIKSAGMEADNLNLTVMIDTMAQTIESPNGYSGGTINDAIGKSFSMVISSTGKELDLSAANETKFEIPGSGESNASQSFADFFPDVPAKKIKPGHKWHSTDSVNSEAGVSKTISLTEADNTFEGVETVDGIDCAKITAVLTGTYSMETEAQGMEVKMSGEFTGTGVVYFAIKEGYFISQSSELKMEGTLELIYPQEMTMPLTMEINSSTEIVK